MLSDRLSSCPLIVPMLENVQIRGFLPEIPFANSVDFQTGVLQRVTSIVERRLGELKGVYKDVEAWQKAVASGNPVVYHVLEVKMPEDTGHLQYCTTILYPGKVGREFFATKGHYHAKRKTAEIYLCLSGEGILLLQNENGDEQTLPMTPGRLNYIAPGWAHRTTNVGEGPLVFLSVWPGDAGHDYEAIVRQGFHISVENVAGKPVAIKRIAE